MADRKKLITTLQYRINEARNKGEKVTTIFVSTLSDCLSLLNEQEKRRFLIDETGHITPLPLKEQESRWVSIPHKKDRVCERCGYDEPYKNAEKETMIYKFCPNCGARMNGGDGE